MRRNIDMANSNIFVRTASMLCVFDDEQLRGGSFLHGWSHLRFLCCHFGVIGLLGPGVYNRDQMYTTGLKYMVRTAVRTIHDEKLKCRVVERLFSALHVCSMQ